MTVRIEKSGSVWTVILSRPEARNAMNPESADALQEAFLEFEKDDSAFVAVFWGEGGAFCAGWDLKHAASLEGDRPLGELDFPESGNPPRGAMGPSRLELDKPVIAAVNGAAFAGGLGLVGAADIVIAREDVQFSFSEVRIGVIPAVISVVCIPKLGTHHAMKLFITGERFSGSQAVDMGFAHRAVPKDQLVSAVNEEIDMINRGGPIAVVECKKLVR